MSDLVLGLFAPTRYEINEYRGYNIAKMKDKFRVVKFLKDRDYGLANFYLPLYFNGANNIFKELPNKQDINDEVYEKIIKGEY